jgi:biopolymer transport protein TolR
MAMSLPSARGKGRRAPMADINVTPLVDVMLVLLIIFMVTAPLLTAGVPVDLPDSRAKALEQDAKPINLSVERDGGVFLDDARLKDDDLPGILADLAKRAPAGQPPQVFLRADRGLDYGKVMRVMGELNHAGLNRVALLTVGKDDQ